MTPEPTEALRAARQTIADVVLPAVADEFAREQAHAALRILSLLEATIERSYPLEVEEHDDVARFLGSFAASGGRGSELGTRAAALAAEATERRPLPTFRELREASKRMKALVGEIAAAGLGGAALRGLAARQVERERMWTPKGTRV